MRTAFAGAQRYAFFGVREETCVNDAQSAEKIQMALLNADFFQPF